MKRTITITVDVEPDCPPYLRTYRGIESGLPELLQVLEKYGIEATFFITGEVASKYPMQIKEIAKHHEIGCHGYSHTRFDRMTYREAVYEIEKSTEVLCRLTGQESITSFRAPNLIFPERFLGILKDNGYLIDSSIAGYKIGDLYRAKMSNLSNGLLRIPASATSSLLRLPFGNEIIRRMRPPIVLFFHPWEFVEMYGEPVRWDCKVNTGKRALQNLELLIKIFKNKHYRFCTISSFLAH
ncbi:putative xylanase/chitin deacetylase [Candidatus Methanoperedens nitroreducens]|uniref:Putative xylanase/chitin deacetylase n=1 Tax=Candidatus Methanoperedens nitratireducens TaxID=1392998 RepID=A0A062V0D9_9EURY|nr:polysaccharide deacetylase family protein [Candidatus Methanoperedens nitroreducens]KCZ70847.1 putative xylanase/chitin deacetylase [Candidatus Methanoperedens nitroreducens]MDJ1420702.1 polysaccharide deacetylase family protein [Candidatus Methanoperedens sp.]